MTTGGALKTARGILRRGNAVMLVIDNTVIQQSSCKYTTPVTSPLKRVRIPNTAIFKTKLGVEVTGLQLSEVQKFPDSLKEEIRQLVHQKRLVIFRDQCEVDGAKHAEISEWFGPLDNSVPKGDPLYVHPKCPHPDIHRISNDAKEGCRDAGRSGWHIDGSLLQKPFGYALYHMVKVPATGATEFVGFRELLESIPVGMRRRWCRLWTIPDRGEKPIHPLVYRHPVTGLPVLCIHLGMIEAFIYDKGTEKEKVTEKEETRELIEEITNEIEKGDKRLVYSHEWQKGDFIISDNLAVGHYASANSQRSPSEIGLRVLHRTTVQGTSSPKK